MELQYYQLCKSSKFWFGYNFFVWLDNFDKKTGIYLLTRHQKQFYSFRCTKCNILNYVDFDVAFFKDCILELINSLKKGKGHEVVVVRDYESDNDDVLFIGKFQIDPRDRLQPFIKQEK